MTGPVEPRENRKLNRALRLGGVGDHIGRLVIAAVVVILTLAALGVMAVPIAPATEGYGVVSTLGFTETDAGSKPYANVRLGDRDVRVGLDRGGLCRVGDRIVVRTQRTLFGERHRAGVGGCGRPPA